MRQGKHPREACLMTLERIARTTREKRLLFANGRPKFDISFYALDKAGRYGSAVMYAFSTIGRRRQFAVADASGAQRKTAPSWSGGADEAGEGGWPLSRPGWRRPVPGGGAWN